MTNSYKTAVKKDKPSTPLRDFMDKKRILSTKEMMFSFYDHGCGKGNDMKWLRDQGFLVEGWDPWHSAVAPSRKKRDVVTCTYVINIISDKKERAHCMQEAWLKVRKGGVMILSTRTKREIDQLAKKNGWKKHKDGYLTKSRTFQKGFTLKELTNFAVKNLPKIKSIIPIEDKKISYSAIYITKIK